MRMYLLRSAVVLIGIWLLLLVATSVGSAANPKQEPPQHVKLENKSSQPNLTPEQAVALTINDLMETEEGYRLSHPHYVVDFTADDVQVIPRLGGPNWQWYLTFVGTANESISTVNVGSVHPTLEHEQLDLIVYHRGSIVEQYVVHQNVVEQQFIVPKALALDGQDLIISGKVASPGQFLEHSTGWLWRTREGEVSLGKVTVYDAVGRELPATMSVTATETEITVNAKALAQATYPVTIDPEIGTNDFRISNMGPDGNTTYGALEPDVAYNSTENEYLVVWHGDTSLAGFEWEIYGQRIDAATGTEVGPDDFRISDMGPDGNTAYGAYNPMVTYNSISNQYIVVWYGVDNTSPLVNDEYEVFGQLLTADGIQTGTNDFRISNMGPDGNINYAGVLPVVAHNSKDNEYMVIWKGDDNTFPLVDDEFEVFGQRLTASGTPTGTNFRISNMGPDGNPAYDVLSFPDIAYNSMDNEYLVVWHGDDNTPPLVDGETEIFGQLLTASGTQTGTSDFRISDMGSDGNSNYDAKRPAVTYNSTNNEYLVVWQGDDNTGSLVDGEVEVFGQRVNAATGAEIGVNDFRLSDMGPDGPGPYAAFEPEVAYNSVDNEYLVIWRGSDNTPPLVALEWEIFGQRINAATGVEIGANDFRLSDMGPDGDTNYGALSCFPNCMLNYQAVAYNSINNEYLIVWDGDDNTSPLVDDEFEIFGQRFTVQLGGQEANCYTQVSSTPGITYTTIQSAVDVAGDSDTVKVAGTCTGVEHRAGISQTVYIDKNITLQGGYTTTNWATPDPVANPTKLDAQGLGQVIYITGDSNVTVEGLHITGGNGSWNDGNGGGVSIREATVTLQNNWIEENVASSDPDTWGNGGGVYAITGTLSIYNNTIQNNVAYSVTLPSPDVGEGGVGGGIVIGDASSAVITGNQISENVGTRSNIFPDDVWGGGGGIAWWGENITLDDNIISGNTGNQAGGNGDGGGIGLWGDIATVINNSILRNTAAVSGTFASGGGLIVGDFQMLTLTGNQIMSNTAIITASGTPTETWAGGGGIQVYGGTNVSLEDNQIIANITARTMRADGANPSAHAEGGGLRLDNVTTTLVISNVIAQNRAVELFQLNGDGETPDQWGGRPAGGGLYLADIETLTINNNDVQGNFAAKKQILSEVGSSSEGGGVVLINVGSASISGNKITDNTAVVTGSITSGNRENYFPEGGGVRIGCWDRTDCNLSFTKNDISNNKTASNIIANGDEAESGAEGGGIGVSSVPTLTLTGNTISQNTAVISISGSDAEGGGIKVSNAQSLTLTSNRIISNTAGDSLTGLDPYASGGGLRVSGYDTANDSVLLKDNYVAGNLAAGSMTASGLGAEANAEGGGLWIDAVASARIFGNEVSNNTAVKNISVSRNGGWGGRPSGGGMYFENIDMLTVRENQVQDNVTAEQQTVNEASSDSNGGGIALFDIQNGTITANLVSDNVAVLNGSLTSDADENYYPGGGGIQVACWNRPDCQIIVQNNELIGNQAASTLILTGSDVEGGDEGAGLRSYSSNVTMSQNKILNNQSYDNPVVWAWESVLTSTNNIFANNSIGGLGVGGFNKPASANVMNDTYYNNDETGIQASSNATVLVTNTIVFSHQFSFDVYMGGGAILNSDYNLLSNVENYEDATPGVNDIINQDPKFVDVDNNDFHLASNSPAIDKGTYAGAPDVDFEGDSRPYNSEVDIGADESLHNQQRVYLPVVLK